jgi:isochorismate synthase
MADILIYRIPEKEVVDQTGEFRRTSVPDSTSNFCIANSNKSALYYFHETGEKAAYFYSDRAPYAVSKKEYLMGGESLIHNFDLHGLQKAVYGRVKSVYFDETKCREMFDELCERYPKAFVYLVSSELFGTWIGATPEVLLSMHGHQGYTMSLAGTKKVHAGEAWDDKEMEEQYIVTEFIQNRLLNQDLQEIEQHGPFDIDAGPVKHLRTDFSFYSPDKSAIDIALELHPTPAVAGVPTKIAQDLVATIEPFYRDLYTGFIGATDEKNSYLYVNLRCCQILPGKAYLYIGGGYTSSSIPEDEWEETENKARTLLDILEKIDPR